MKRLFISLTIILCAFSCTKNSDIDNLPNKKAENFYALTVGNSWVYKNFKYNSATELYEDSGIVDSVSIVGTEIISNETYYKFRRFTAGNDNNENFCNPNGEHFEFFREIDGDLVNSDGEIKFTNNNYEERLFFDAGWGIVYETLEVDETIKNVEAGAFNCINSKRYAKISGTGEILPGIDRFYYSKGIGLIYNTSSFTSIATPIFIRQLSSYNVQ